MNGKNISSNQSSLSPLLTLAGLLFVYFFSSSKQVSVTTFSPNHQSASSPISWNEATNLRNFYKNSGPLMIETSPNQSVPLEGFKISASQLLEIINSNKNGGKADEVMFYFGAEQPAPGFSNPSFHIIAVGVKNNSLMIPSTEDGQSNANNSSIIDKADPCPPMCPK